MTRSPSAEEVLPGVFRVGCPFGQGGIVFVYYVDAPEAAIVDTGVKSSPRGAIEPALNAAGKSLAAVRHIFNTHGHWDHAGGNEETRRLAPAALTYLHPNDRHLLQSVDAHVFGYSSYAARLLKTPGGVEAVERMQRPEIDAPSRLDVAVSDGDTYRLGGGRRVRAVHTPGHSRGSTSYLLEDAGALFTGDAIQGLGSRPGQLPLVFDDSQAYRATIAKVAELEIEALYTGHAFCNVNPNRARDSVRRGEASRAFLVESGEAAKAVEEASRSILAAEASLAFNEFARRLFTRLAQPLRLVLDENGMNPPSMATAHAFYRELTGAPLPA